MIKLKNIQKKVDCVTCDAYLEDCETAAPLKLNTKSGVLADYHLPDGYEWCKSHIGHAKNFLLSSKLPKETVIMWY